MDRVGEIREMEHKHKKLSYNQITPLIYAGNNMCCQMHFEQELLSKGVEVDISLEKEAMDNPRGINYFFWFPWEDDAAPAIELIELAIDIVEMLVRREKKMYIHCRNGHGRTVTFLSCYFIRTEKVSTKEALYIVLNKRPSGHINDIQKMFLKEYEQYLRSNGRL